MLDVSFEILYNMQTYPQYICWCKRFTKKYFKTPVS
jgi:hypothetical protein